MSFASISLEHFNPGGRSWIFSRFGPSGKSLAIAIVRFWCGKVRVKKHYKTRGFGQSTPLMKGVSLHPLIKGVWVVRVVRERRAQRLTFWLRRPCGLVDPREGEGVEKFIPSLSLQFPNAVVLNAVGRRNPQKGAKERKRAQKSAKERFRVKSANNQVKTTRFGNSQKSKE